MPNGLFSRFFSYSNIGATHRDWNNNCHLFSRLFLTYFGLRAALLVSLLIRILITPPCAINLGLRQFGSNSSWATLFHYNGEPNTWPVKLWQKCNYRCIFAVKLYSMDPSNFALEFSGSPLVALLWKIFKSRSLLWLILDHISIQCWGYLSNDANRETFCILKDF